MKNTLPIALQFSLLLTFFITDISRTVRTLTTYEKTGKVVTYKMTEKSQAEIEHGRRLKPSNWAPVDSSRLSITRKIKSRTV
ncbi:hypothetical protein [Companilactobacillus furfuricola]|uniref:hypothetical protein n=1 Tax=Companilactobacillus furfuricola TaxID=1462575 RepID=UPI000F7673B7|nr:hypothetical protein [Companilactobacillus furfuricola]